MYIISVLVNPVTHSAYRSAAVTIGIFFPVCGSDGRNYFSPCHAGCSSVDRMVGSTLFTVSLMREINAPDNKRMKSVFCYSVYG